MDSLRLNLARLLFAGCLVLVWWLDQRDESGGATLSVGFRLRDVAAASGIDFRHEPASLDAKIARIEPQVAALGAAVSVCDPDGDGLPDLYTTRSALGRPNALWLNEGGGLFREAAASAGLADLNQPGEGASMGSIWADYDGDGDQDAFLYRYGFTALLRNEGELRFRDVAAEAGVRRWMNSNAASWIDFDRDGDLDLYVAGYFSERHDLWRLETTRIMQESFEFATNGGHNVLFENRGDGTFEDVTEAYGADSTRWTMATAAFDLDGDGWVDLYLANDYGPEEYLRNVGGERFELMEDVGLAESSKSGMCVAVGDFENGGSLGVYVTNISRRGFLFQGNNLRLNRLREFGQLVNLAETSMLARHVADCGWAWGAQFGDLDNDGLQDLFVANGFISADPEREYWYDMAKIAGSVGEVVEDALNWPEFGDKSLSGFERSRVLRNFGKRRFRDVAEAVGVDDRFDGRAVALADLAGRGTLDVIVANQAGPLLVYRSESPPENDWIRLHLTGSDGNSDAIGAQVELRWNGRTQTQAVLAGSGFSAQNELVLHFGLGPDARVEGARVRWPSGREQELGPLAVRHVHELREPRP